VASLPSKNEIWRARVAHKTKNAAHFGTIVDGVKTDMRGARSRNQDITDRNMEAHPNAYRESCAELMMGTGRRYSNSARDA